MSNPSPRLLATGASGQLGRLVIDALLARVPAGQIVAMQRDKAAGAAPGVEIRQADYNAAATLDAALVGIDRVLLISSNALGTRVAQHGNFIEAAKRAGVGLLAYTSVLHADRSPLGLAGEHRETEALLRESGLPHVVLRNGWYNENYTAAIPAALAHHALIGSAGDGQIASAARADYAAAAAVVLTATEHQAGRIFELAGDSAYTLTDLAAELTRQSGQTVGYTNLPQAAYRDTLQKAGLPPEIAELLADSDACAAHGALFDDSRQLSALIGRPTTPMSVSVAAALGTQ
jgi:NAD(P)H dehydrogenase (quinone)